MYAYMRTNENLHLHCDVAGASDDDGIRYKCDWQVRIVQDVGRVQRVVLVYCIEVGHRVTSGTPKTIPRININLQIA